jgi:hypothetical protein
MKIRLGFVSNSSSSSFCIYGCSFGREEIQKLLNADEEYGFDSYDFEKKYNIECYDFENEYYIGKSFTKIQDNQTGKQFKEEIETKLKTIFGKDIKCSILSEAWYNG